MRGLEEIKFINANPKIHAQRRDEATVRCDVGEPSKRLAAQAFHGERLALRQRTNGRPLRA